MTKGNRKILLVDDDGLFLEIASEAIESLGHSVIAVAKGTAALECLESENVDLLLTDANLGDEMNGYDLARRAREWLPDLPILYISGDKAYRRVPDDAPSAPFLAKPAPLDNLARAIDAAIDAGRP